MSIVLKPVSPDSTAVLGIPVDGNSSFLRGTALAPGRIREALYGGSANLCAENGLDLSEEPLFIDVGDIGRTDEQPGAGGIETAVSHILHQQAKLLTLGGDHSITYPIIKAHAPIYPNLTILHIDAHPDLYDDFEGNPHSHASPFARIMEQGLAKRLIQIGIRTMNAHQRQQAERFGVEVIEMRDWKQGIELNLTAPLYLSLDLDAFDPAYAPGVSHHEPGGFTAREIITLIQNLPVPLVGADIVELNPTRDLIGMTAMLAAKLLKEIAAVMMGG